MLEPHGRQLVNKISEGKQADEYRNDLNSEDAIRLNSDTYQELLNIATGRYSPIDGFVTQNDFLKILSDMSLEDGTRWPFPITLDVDTERASNLTPGQRVGLEAPDGTLVGGIDISEVYTYNPESAVEQLFGTTDPSHPGVEQYLSKDDFLVGGEVFLFEYERAADRALLPVETRVLFNKNDWKTVVGFQTRNVPHRAHEYLQKSALELVDGLLVQPKIGNKKTGDYRDELILNAYRVLIDNYYPDNRVTLSVFPCKMRYAGPREAMLDAIVRKNQGCTHFVVGRDHAGVGDYYNKFESQRIFEEYDNIGIEILEYGHAFYCHVCDGMASEKICPHNDHQVYPSGTKIRELVDQGEVPPPEMMRPEVGELILDAENPFVTGVE